MNDTIVAISTPAGRGGIGIVRLSGEGAKRIAEGLVRLKRPLEAGRVRFGFVLDEGGADEVKERTGKVKAGTDNGEIRGSFDSVGREEPRPTSLRMTALAEGVDASERDDAARRGEAAVLDEAVVTYFAGPRSYTGEDVVEIAVHGAPVLLYQILRQSVGAGARLAEPGEFTQRAFLAGRIDLTQAEAVHGLIEATTLQQARTAAMQLSGGLSRQVAPVKRELIELIAALEAGIDFAEDDLDLMPDVEIARRVEGINAPLKAMEDSFAYGRVLREGFRLAIVGRPNAGKSSLFNQLIGRDRSIVTAQAGTTRDTVSERLELGGIPLELVDTAGLRETADEAEGFGVARAREAMAEADVVLLVVAADSELHDEDRAVIAGAVGRRLIVAVNKVDLVERLGSGDALAAGFVKTSAVEGTGIEELRRLILGAVEAVPAAADTVPVTNLRQQLAITAAALAVRAAQVGLEERMPHEMVLLDLHEALGALDQLTGTTHTEEILAVIFGSFCVGK